MTTEATVLRAARDAALPSDELVPGDIVFLQSGDKIPDGPEANPFQRSCKLMNPP